jgi:hypothetical protein
MERVCRVLLRFPQYAPVNVEMWFELYHGGLLRDRNFLNELRKREN